MNKLKTDEDPTKYEQYVLETITALFSSPEPPALTADDLAFLDLDLGTVDLAALASAPSPGAQRRAAYRVRG